MDTRKSRLCVLAMRVLQGDMAVSLHLHWMVWRFIIASRDFYYWNHVDTTKLRRTNITSNIMQARDIPNVLSIIRIFLSIPVVMMLLQRNFDIALVLFAVAGISDGLDGYLAKRFGWQSRLGGLLDPLADKILLVFSILSLWSLGLLPAWLVTIVILRDLVIVTGAFVYNFQVAELDASPSMISKFNTVVQIVLVLAVVLNQGFLSLPAMLLQGLILLTLITTIWSGLNYVVVWSKRAADHNSDVE
jgi:cardiolipin synthase